MPELFEALFYFRGTYGVQKGSIEYLVDTSYLIKKFSDHGFSKIDYVRLDNFKNKNNKILSRDQLRVSRYHVAIIFNKI